MKTFFNTNLILVLLISFITPSLSQSPFITKWKTNNPGSSNNSSITIPVSDFYYNYDVDWDNDGTYDDTNIHGPITHDYVTPGTYIIRIQGTFPTIAFEDGGDKDKILEIIQWGTISWGTFVSSFEGCSNLTLTATDVPDLTNVTELAYMFAKASSFNTNINNWNVSHIEWLSGMFKDATSFNQPLNNWNVSNVIDLVEMFEGATSFDQPLFSWSVGNVTSMNSMFKNATSFNEDLSFWNFGKVTDMYYIICWQEQAN